MDWNPIDQTEITRRCLIKARRKNNLIYSYDQIQGSPSYCSILPDHLNHYDRVREDDETFFLFVIRVVSQTIIVVTKLERLTVAPRACQNASHTWETNWGPQSETISRGLLDQRKAWCTRWSAVSQSVGSLERATRGTAFDNWSTMISTTVLCDGGRALSQQCGTRDDFKWVEGITDQHNERTFLKPRLYSHLLPCWATKSVAWGGTGCGLLQDDRWSVHSLEELGMDRSRHKQAVRRTMTWVGLGLLSHNRLDLPAGLSAGEQFVRMQKRMTLAVSVSTLK